MRLTSHASLGNRTKLRDQDLSPREMQATHPSPGLQVCGYSDDGPAELFRGLLSTVYSLLYPSVLGPGSKEPTSRDKQGPPPSLGDF